MKTAPNPIILALSVPAHGQLSKISPIPRPTILSFGLEAGRRRPDRPRTGHSSIPSWPGPGQPRCTDTGDGGYVAPMSKRPHQGPARVVVILSSPLCGRRNGGGCFPLDIPAGALSRPLLASRRRGARRRKPKIGAEAVARARIGKWRSGTVQTIRQFPKGRKSCYLYDPLEPLLAGDRRQRAAGVGRGVESARCRCDEGRGVQRMRELRKTQRVLGAGVSQLACGTLR